MQGGLRVARRPIPAEPADPRRWPLGGDRDRQLEQGLREAVQGRYTVLP